MTAAEALRALLDALPRCGVSDDGQRCDRIATRESAHPSGWMPCCDDDAHVWATTARARGWRPLPYAREVRDALAALAALDGH